ncbi:hypothetical protein [Halomarina oriensis]|uniref:DUF8118 domain-containing protein n=1 Tax=Halomarina oriensis TaxID=671145 RepID=A0A6B0GMV8_9EURY|nr:hypothetical protein [Halomarina oriensis]MWG36000.1 hypothetical protein [Halomarina oriensis]
MAGNQTHRQPRIPTGHDDHGTSDRSPSVVTGPHAGYDRYGHLDHYYYRCERCGLESTDATLVEGCPRCRETEARR